ncbi:Bcr/CflA family drug resistance efflux transporter [Streptomyces sp. Ru73]|uniref:multidrug effflux MFS transporter n=1 Tax=Streptomyces sp. Ru73 TaxID=2080748 RepID=UPI000CDDB1A8|nr:multidrug effflux MFS transporter [Streptomyces sp. Ru73]POX36962.1 Bcr/CflA family drug resistance efflux transporter [Streptomyces sp. Ru73]
MVSPPHTSSDTPPGTDAGRHADAGHAEHAADAAGRPPKRAGALIAVLGALTGVAPLATDMYVPGFPAMGATLHASSSAVQLTMTAFLAGLVVGQVLVGPVSDGLGRRGLLIWGSIGFTVLSVACAVAPTIEVLTAARFLQGVCGAAGMVLARAVLTDLFHGPDIPRYFALLSQILGVAPVAAPVVGGAVLSVATWRAVFVVLAAIGALLLLAVLAKVPESLPSERRHRGGIGGTFRAMGALLGNRAFMGYVLVLGFSAAALFGYISGSSFVFENLYGVSATVYSLIFACNAIAMLLAGAAFGRLARRRVPLNTLLTAGVCVSVLGALVQVLLLATVGGTLAGTWICLFLTLGGIGVTFPATMSLGQTLGRAAPGAASALLGGLQFLFGAVASPLVGAFGEDSSAPMALLMLIALAAAALCLLTLVRPWQRRGETTG